MEEIIRFQEAPHRRLNILTGEWVQVSPHRTRRPWQGREESRENEQRPSFDPNCYLCPGNERAGGARNPDYDSVFVFDNDFSALMPDTEPLSLDRDRLLVAQSERGICRVVCFSPRHDLTLAELDLPAIERVIRLWIAQYEELGADESINYVQIFENKGEMMGCSNPHPHGQIWAQETIPDEPRKELAAQEEYYRAHGSTLLGDYLRLELELQERVVLQNETFVALVPFWAFWPFETLIVPKRCFGRFTGMNNREVGGLADLLKRLTARYDNLFQVPFPYSAGFHPAPTDGKEHPEWHFHMHFYPPLLRSASVRKFRVGYEMLASPQRDVTAEESARILRDLPDRHYKRT